MDFTPSNMILTIKPNAPLTKQLLFDALLLTVAALVVYCQVAGFEVLTNWDDPEYITENHLIRSISWENIQGAFTSTLMGNYAPFQNLSYMFDMFLAGGVLKPAVLHVSNLIWHIANTLLLYWFVVRVVKSRVWALTAAFLFLLHPVQVETVAWLSQRKNLLSMFFFLLTLIAYDFYRKEPEKKRWLFYTASFLCCVIALFSKVSVVIIPVVLVCYDFFLCAPSQRPTLKLSLFEKLPFVFAVSAMAYQSSILQMKELGGGRAAYHGGSLYTTMVTMVHVLGDYILNIIWPTGLSAIYTPPVVMTPSVVTIGILVLLVLVVLICVARYRQNKTLVFAVALFFVGLLPVSQIIPLVTLMHDRYLYIPMIGVAWFAGGVIHLILHKRPDLAKSVLTVTLIICVSLGALSFQRAKVWRSSIALWTDTVEKLPENWGVWDALAEAYISKGDKDGALRAYDKVFSMKPDYMDEDAKEIKALNNAGALFMERGDITRSRDLLDKLTTKYPDYAPGFINRGLNALLQKDMATAERSYMKALELEPGNTSALMGMGTVQREKGNLKDARNYYFKSFGNRGDGPELRFNWACLESKSGNADEALMHLEVALKKGFADQKVLASSPDLDNIREHAGFKSLMEKYFPGPLQNR